MRFQDKINDLVEKDMSRRKVLDCLLNQQRWFEDYATTCNSSIDRIINANFKVEER